ncbi:MAG: radical SAM protein [Candidatus Omnitrophota bacterium]
MDIKKFSFNRPLGLRDIWGLRAIFSIIFTRLCRPKIIINLLLFLYNGIFKCEKVSNMPLYLMLEPSSRCNLKCKMCWRTLYKFNRPEGDMPYAEFKEIIDKIGDCLIFVGLWNYGEPLLNPELNKMIAYCSKKGIVTVLSTNGTLLDRAKSLDLFAAGLKYLIICVDGVTEEVYQEYRNTAKLAEVENNVRQVCDLKKEKRSKFPVIELQFIVMKGNEHQVDEFFPLAYSWGLDRAVLKKVSMLKDIKLADDFLPRNDNYLLDCYKSTGKSIPKGFCDIPWQTMVVNSDGWVVPCCSDYFSLEKTGNVFVDSIDKIWNNNNYIKLRSRMKNDINPLGVCNNCPHHSGHTGSFISARNF